MSIGNPLRNNGRPDGAAILCSPPAGLFRRIHAAGAEGAGKKTGCRQDFVSSREQGTPDPSTGAERHGNPHPRPCVHSEASMRSVLRRVSPPSPPAERGLFIPFTFCIEISLSVKPFVDLTELQA